MPVAAPGSDAAVRQNRIAAGGGARRSAVLHADSAGDAHTARFEQLLEFARGGLERARASRDRSSSARDRARWCREAKENSVPAGERRRNSDFSPAETVSEFVAESACGGFRLDRA